MGTRYSDDIMVTQKAFALQALAEISDSPEHTNNNNEKIKFIIDRTKSE